MGICALFSSSGLLPYPVFFFSLIFHCTILTFCLPFVGYDVTCIARCYMTLHGLIFGSMFYGVPLSYQSAAGDMVPLLLPARPSMAMHPTRYTPPSPPPATPLFSIALIKSSHCDNSPYDNSHYVNSPYDFTPQAATTLRSPPINS